MRKWAGILLMMVSGCISPSYHGPLRYVIGVPMVEAAAAPGTVYLRHDAKQAADGNTYVIEYLAMTNCNSDLVDDPAVQEYNADLATNRWPFKRMHIDLSLDGGATWPQRVGYGVSAGISPFGELIWSPPENYSLLTTNARLRLTKLDGTLFGHRGDGKPYDVPTNTFITSERFTIAGANITAPADGAIFYAGFPIDITWVQAGCGEIMTLMWITPQTATNALQQVITVFSNCVEGVNTRTIAQNFPPAVEVKLVIQSKSDPAILGYSGIIDVVP